MDVAAYLKELLNQEQNVFVSGLGTFLLRKTPVQHNQKQHYFSPPKNWIDFVAEEKTDDKLEKYISQQKNISPQAAHYFIEKFVDQLKKEATAKNIPVKEALFPAEMEAELNYQNADASFNQVNFGLPSVKISTLKIEPPVVAKEVVTDKEALTKQDYVENFYREFSTNLPQEEIKPQKNTSFWVAIVLLLAICCLGIYALYLYYPNVFKGLLPVKQQEVTLVKPPTADTLKPAPVPVAKETISDTTAKVVADTPATIVKNIAPAPQKTTIDTLKTANADMVAKSPYEIIGASFKTLKGAKTFLSQLQARGMHHAKILNNTAGKQVLITFGSYQDKAAALNALEKIRTKDSHSEAYIQHYLK
ncbi:MAG: SPOR domain-containing protein [Janthinobacterium lividum]